MKTLTGHLTATDKRNISAMMELGLKQGTINKKSYFLSQQNGIYTVKLQQKDRGLIPCPGSPLRISAYTATFTV